MSCIKPVNRSRGSRNWPVFLITLKARNLLIFSVLCFFYMLFIYFIYKYVNATIVFEVTHRNAIWEMEVEI